MSQIMTRAQFSQMAKRATLGAIVAWYPFLATTFVASSIDNDPRQSAIMASGLNETGGWTVFDEFTYKNTPYSRVAQVFGSSAPSLQTFTEWQRTLGQYDFDVAFFNHVYDDANRPPGYRLGNTRPGDGYKFRGMGPGALTGRGNYTWMSKELNLPLLVETPEVIKTPEVGSILLTHFWVKNDLNVAVDDGSLSGFLYAMRRLNAGLDDFSNHTSLWYMTTAVMANDDIPEYVVPTRDAIDAKKDAVRDLQRRLWGKGYDPKGVDGIVGPGTSAAIGTFELTMNLKKDGLVDDEMLEKLRRPFLGMRAGATDKDAVRTLQTKLVEGGESIGPTGVDGDFGFFTTSALQRVQVRAGLRGTGVLDPSTMELIKLAA